TTPDLSKVSGKVSGNHFDNVTSGNVLSISARTQQLVQVAQAFQQALHRKKLIDLSELYWRSLDRVAHTQPPNANCLAPQTVLIYGYFQPRWDELAWINAIAADGSVMVLPVGPDALFQQVQEGIDWLVDQGWNILPKTSDLLTVGERLSQIFVGDYKSDKERKNESDRPWNGEGERADTALVHCYGTVEAEVRGTLTQVKALLQNGIAARDIAIIARNEVAYGPQLMDIGWEYGMPIRALYDTPILSTRLGAWLNLLMEVMDTGWPFEATAKLLSHPLGSNPDGNFWAVVRGEHPVGFAQWQAIAHHHLQLDLSGLANVNRQRRPETWVEWWNALFQTFDLRQRCARWPRESIAFNTLRQGMVELAKSEEGAIAWSDFRQELRDLLALLMVPAQPGRGGVELHKPTSVAGARYRHVFVIGMVEGVLPAAIDNDPVLDFFERQWLQSYGLTLPTAVELARREALSFSALLQTATETITFSYAQLTDRQEQLPSPYLKRLGLGETALSVKAIASAEELRQVVLRHNQPLDDKVLPHASHAFIVEQHRESRAAPDEYDGVVGIPFDYSNWKFSASQLRNLGQCPFKWFADKALKLGLPTEIEEDLSPSQIGQLYHQVLELILAEKQRNPELDITGAGILGEKFAIAEADIIPSSLSSWNLRRNEHLRCLALALASPDFLPDGAVPLLLEASFQGEWQGLAVKGKVDRIDRTGQGLILIDYKTGKSRPPGIKDSNGTASIDIQLPLYQEAAGPQLFPDESVSAAYYYFIRGGAKIPLSTKAPQHELPDAIARCKAHLDQGHYPVQPDRQESACKYCDFDALCRRGDRLSRKENKHVTD
ncbi:MAG: PD-(D/E)XK nuclease family protein, partial [Leptolyngbyaceae bacterium]|nr:PD-(D/E)XK nuclease family protein [Leptolyngbyaceae bacterium]